MQNKSNSALFIALLILGACFLTGIGAASASSGDLTAFAKYSEVGLLSVELYMDGQIYTGPVHIDIDVNGKPHSSEDFSGMSSYAYWILNDLGPSLSNVVDVFVTIPTSGTTDPIWNNGQTVMIQLKPGAIPQDVKTSVKDAGSGAVTVYGTTPDGSQPSWAYVIIKNKSTGKVIYHSQLIETIGSSGLYVPNIKPFGSSITVQIVNSGQSVYREVNSRNNIVSFSF